VVKEIVVIRKEKKKKKLVPPPPKPIVILKVGDKVRMIDGKSVGSIDTIEKNKAIVNYGIFTTQVSLDQLEKV
jgi:DNA mismatch repair protein MutS2